MERVLVVGGLSGIGKSVVEYLKMDFIVETLSRSEKISDLNQIKHHSIDATIPHALKNYFYSLHPYEHVVVTAGDTPMGSLHLLSDEEARYAITNKFWLSYVVARDIPWRKSLTFISGSLSVRPGENSALQSAINAGIEGMTRSIALECAPARVNCISPGVINAGRWDRVAQDIRQKSMESASRRTLVGHVGNPLHIAQAVKFIIECDYLTAEIIYVDGGSRFGQT
ncbi:SDR family oxidoreductase [Xenorhabdus sp. KJ12.1]|uniref:SDR family oxidoreductase n=1 Tax=Xenorhabdus sp. KJ12.1 TaxID=1851571 RepID=UPI000C03C383|nr:SDR family oxidoreductase [Xenorhabdus sp. KJ12.1]PHM72299.1 3-oxoacyl-ACP reductase [Xenorhabdus sp. KJ12.1]